MFDIGLGEIIALAAIALLVFGPDQLPKAASSAGRMVRQVREMATSARKELGDSVELDSITEDFKSLADLHPKRILSSALEDAPDSAGSAQGSGSSGTSGSSGSNGRSTKGAANGAPAGGTAGASETSAPSGTGSYDPDAT